MKISPWKTACFCLVSAWSTQSFANSACDANDPLVIVSATDDGLYEETHGPENTLDNNFDPDSRWSNQGQGEPKHLLIDLGAVQTVQSLNIAWYKGDSRKSTYAIQASVDGTDFNIVVPERQSMGASLEFEPNDLGGVKAQYIRIAGNGNESNDWNSIVEVSATGCGEPVEAPATPILTPRQGAGLFGLNPELPPGKNFDLLGWYVTTPADDDGDGKSDSVYENELAAGWTDPRFFYTDPATGGMVFRVTPAGAKTSQNTSYTRTELRGMLRRGDQSIATRIDGGIPNKNNWVFSSAPVEAQAKSAGVNGVLKATLKVNQVTRLGKAYQVGRVIIGQIHAKDDEPIRLYYRKLPQNKYGSIYYAHEPATGKEQWIEVIGKRGDRVPNPDDGIALDETFSYEIEVKGKLEGDQVIPMLHLKIIRDDGSEVIAEPFDMRDSGFNIANEFMFFKAGAYTGNNTSPDPDRDFDKVTFYELEYSHDEPPAGDPSAAATQAAVMPADASANAAASNGTVFNDSFADGSRDDGADESDTNWWHTTNSAALEIAENSLGLVSGGSGRGLRTTFAPQTLADGQTIKATFTFTTPETIGQDRDSAFRVGLYDKLGRAELEGDLSASSKAPNTNYDGLPGYMIDFDVNLKDAAAANIDIRKHKDDTQGRLLGTTKGYTKLDGGGDAYQFEAGKTYTGIMAVTKANNGLEISGSLMHEDTLLSSFSTFDEGSDTNNFGMLAFHVNSKTFGSSKKAGEPDNGIDFSNVSVEVMSAPASAGMVFDDDFSDGARESSADAADTNWWHTTNSSSLEVIGNTMGLVSGGSGRGIRTTFDPQALAEGQSLQASFTFTTPETIGEDRDSAFRIGMYDKLGRAALEGDLSASSKEPNTNYDGLPGYMIDFDVNLKDAAAANIDIRKHKDDTQGRLLGTTKGYTKLGGGGEPYQFEAGKTYTGTMTITNVSNGVEIAGSLTHDGTVLTQYSIVDEGSDINNIGMLAFHVNSKTFGSSKKREEPDNGLDFSNVKLEVR